MNHEKRKRALKSLTIDADESAPGYNQIDTNDLIVYLDKTRRLIRDLTRLVCDMNETVADNEVNAEFNAESIGGIQKEMKVLQDRINSKISGGH